jgi:1,4-dihydroxy-2-naphthoate octaprenyltransferase
MEGNDFITLNKEDSKFHSYLEGHFSKEWRALPEINFNVDTSRERVTFRLQKVKDILRPNWAVIVFKLFRLEWLSLTFGPILATYAFLYKKEISLSHPNGLLAMFSVFMLHAGLFALNDYRDHISGIDRIQTNGGSQVLQKGWWAAHQVKNLGLTVFCIGVVVGLYLVFQQPFYLILVALFLFVSVFFLSYVGQGLKFMGFGEIIAFLSFGPFLTYGFSRAIGYFHSNEILILGIGFGYHAAIIFFAKQFENMTTDFQLGVKSMALRLGFDKSKNFFVGSLYCLPVIFVGTLFLILNNPLSYFLVLPYSYFIFRLIFKMKSVTSSYSSGVDDLRLKLADIHVLYSTFTLLAIWINGV